MSGFGQGNASLGSLSAPAGAALGLGADAPAETLVKLFRPSAYTAGRFLIRAQLALQAVGERGRENCSFRALESRAASKALPSVENRGFSKIEVFRLQFTWCFFLSSEIAAASSSALRSLPPSPNFFNSPSGSAKSS